MTSLSFVRKSSIGDPRMGVKERCKVKVGASFTGQSRIDITSVTGKCCGETKVGASVKVTTSFPC